MAKHKSTILLLAIGLLSHATPSQACIMVAEFKIEDIRGADVVVAGELVDYEKISVKSTESLSDYAVLKVRAERVLKGSSTPIVQFSWDNSTFNEPPMMAIGKKIIVAGKDPLGRQPPLRGPSATVFAAPRKDMMRVLQAPCSSPFIFSHSSVLEADLRTLLSGERINDVDYSLQDPGLYIWEPTEQLGLNVPWLWTGSLGLIGLIAAVFTIRRKLAQRFQD